MSFSSGSPAVAALLVASLSLAAPAPDLAPAPPSLVLDENPVLDVYPTFEIDLVSGKTTPLYSCPSDDDAHGCFGDDATLPLETEVTGIEIICRYENAAGQWFLKSAVGPFYYYRSEDVLHDGLPVDGATAMVPRCVNNAPLHETQEEFKVGVLADTHSTMTQILEPIAECIPGSKLSGITPTEWVGLEGIAVRCDGFTDENCGTLAAPPDMPLLSRIGLNQRVDWSAAVYPEYTPILSLICY